MPAHPAAAPVGPLPGTRPHAAAKAFASLVIAACLGMQLYVIARPSGHLWWPFLDYPMYASAALPGQVYRLRELRAVACDGSGRRWKIRARTIAHQEGRLARTLSSIVNDGPLAARYRARLGRMTTANVTPRPCALEVWERAVAVNAEGVDENALRVPRWQRVHEWLIAPTGSTSSRR